MEEPLTVGEAEVGGASTPPSTGTQEAAPNICVQPMGGHTAQEGVQDAEGEEEGDDPGGSTGFTSPAGCQHKSGVDGGEWDEYRTMETPRLVQLALSWSSVRESVREGEHQKQQQ